MAPSYVGGGFGDASVTVETVDQSRRALVVLGQSSQTANLLEIDRGSSTVASISGTGSTLFKPSTGNDSVTAFQIQNAAGRITF
ncbi:MAG: hypothetical protein WDN27_03880 [Candidatus Saccharibacteria bacterium]